MGEWALDGHWTSWIEPLPDINIPQATTQAESFVKPKLKYEMCSIGLLELACGSKA